MWYIAIVLAMIVSTSAVGAQKEDEDVVFLVRLPQHVVEELEDQTALEEYYHPRAIYTKRAMPFNGGMYGKRAAAMPFSGGMYGKRSSVGEPIFAQRRAAAIPFSGGMYGKRSASAFSESSYSANENQIKRGAMPFSGGMYGRRR